MTTHLNIDPTDLQTTTFLTLDTKVKGRPYCLLTWTDDDASLFNLNLPKNYPGNGTLAVKSIQVLSGLHSRVKPQLKPLWALYLLSLCFFKGQTTDTNDNTIISNAIGNALNALQKGYEGHHQTLAALGEGSEKFRRDVQRQLNETIQTQFDSIMRHFAELRDKVEDLSFSSRSPAAAAASPSPGSTSNVSSREVSALQDSVATLQRQLSTPSPTVSPDLSNLLQRITVLETKNIQLEADIKVLKATSQPFVSTSTAIGMIVALAAFTFYFFNQAMTTRQPQAS